MASQPVAGAQDEAVWHYRYRMIEEPSHFAFCDESQFNQGRFRSVAMASLMAKDYPTIASELKELIERSRLKEFKWAGLRTAKDRFAALHLIDWTCTSVRDGRIRIDVLVWDTHDSRHQLQGRDDNANLGRMYYHLFRTVLRRRWPDGSRWKLFPDQQSVVKWDELDKFLDRAAYAPGTPQRSLSGDGWKIVFKQEFSVHQIAECKSHEEPLVQIADLFAGLSVYSYTHYDLYADWCRKQSEQHTMFSNMFDEIPRSRADEERCLVLAHLEQLGKKHRFQISLSRGRGLRTNNPSLPMNFWLYESQTTEDKAPKRQVDRRS